jgi:hypothetical protein
MGPFVLLIAGVWAAAQSEPAQLIPLRLQREQEMVYRGSCTEIVEQPGKRTSYVWEVQHCVLIRNVGPRGIEAAFLTIQRAPPQAGKSAETTALLEEGTIEPTGKIVFRPRPNALPRIPLNGPPNLEVAAFVEMPKTGLNGKLDWEIVAENQYPQNWKVQDVKDYPGGGRCVVMIGEQHTPEWKNAAGAAWWRQDTVWLDLNCGYAIKIDRTVRRREEVEAGQLYTTTRTVVKLDNNVPTPCPGGLFRDRLEAIKRTMQSSRCLEQLQQPGGARDLRAYDQLIAEINNDLRMLADTPYREALVTLRRRVEAAKQGERPPVPFEIPKHNEAKPHVEVGQAAPDFATTDLFSKKQFRLSQLQGQPVVLLFFKPSSNLAQYILSYAQNLSGRHAGQVHVLVLAVEGSAEAILPLRNELQLTIEVFAGADAHRLLSGDTTPRAVILDKSGVIRLIAPGWGGDYPHMFDEALEKMLHPAP